MSGPARIQFLFQPARALPSADLEPLVRELQAAARRARPELPALANFDQIALAERILALARSDEGELLGFASARLLPVAGLREALHLEHLSATGVGREELSVRLVRALVAGYGLRFSFPARLWCVFDAHGPSRLAPGDVSQQALCASVAVDGAARRLTRRAPHARERWTSWLGAALTPVARFESEDRVLETGFIGALALLRLALRRSPRARTWTGATPLPASRS